MSMQSHEAGPKSGCTTASVVREAGAITQQEQRKADVLPDISRIEWPRCECACKEGQRVK